MFCFASCFSRSAPQPAGPAPGAGRTQRAQPQWLLRQEAAGRCGAQRALCCACAPCSRPQHGRAGHVGASVTPSLTHTGARTAPRLPPALIPWPTHRGSRVSPPQPARQPALNPSFSCPRALAQRPLLSGQLLCGSPGDTWTRPPLAVTTAAVAAGTWEQREALGHGTLTVRTTVLC